MNSLRGNVLRVLVGTILASWAVALIALWTITGPMTFGWSVWRGSAISHLSHSSANNAASRSSVGRVAATPCNVVHLWLERDNFEYVSRATILRS